MEVRARRVEESIPGSRDFRERNHILLILLLICPSLSMILFYFLHQIVIMRMIPVVQNLVQVQGAVDLERREIAMET